MRLSHTADITAPVFHYTPFHAFYQGGECGCALVSGVGNLKSLRRFCCLTRESLWGPGMEVPPPTAEPLRQLNLPSGAAVQNTNKCEEEKMKRKTLALMLALSMCLSLLPACGSGNTATDDKPPESENVVSSTEQPEESEEPEESKEQPEESEEPKEEEPEESEEPTQEPEQEQPEESEEPELAVPAEMTYTFDTATGTLTCSGGGEVNNLDWLDVVKNAIYDTNDISAAAEVKKVVVERGVTSLGRDAFYGCRNLAEVILPDTLTRIGGYAFQGTALTSIAIPESVTEVGEWAFERCQALSSVNLPGGLTEISNNLFRDCTNLTSIEIPEGVTRIASDAFYGTGLTELVIPEGVSVIASGFIRDTSITSLTLPASLTEWSSYNLPSVMTDVTFLCDATMDNVEQMVGGLLKMSVTIHAPAGSTIEGYVNRQIQSKDNVKCTFVPIT